MLITKKGVDIVDAREIGMREGLSNDGNNGNILAQLATDGKSLYLPEGDWYTDGAAAWSSRTNVSVIGDGFKSRLTQTSTGVKTLSFTDCDGVEVRGIQLLGPNWALGVQADSTVAQAIYILRGKDIHVRDNWLSGFPSHALDLTSSQAVTIANNMFWYNETTGATNHDMEIHWNDGSANPLPMPTQLLIHDNQCYSNNNTSIACIASVNNVVISGNICEPMDLNLVPITNPADMHPKHQIACSYNVSDGETDPATRDEGQAIIANNILRGGNFCTIYLNNNTTTDTTDTKNGGFVGTIHGNVIRQSALSTNSGDTAAKQGGIVVEQYQSVVISSNVIEGVEEFIGVDPQISAGIQVSSLLNPQNEQEIKATVVNNHVQDCKGFGLFTRSEVGQLTVTGNVFQNCKFDYWRQYGTRAKIIATGNQFLGDAQNPAITPLSGSDCVVRFSAGDQITFSDNIIDLSDAVVQGSLYYMIRTAVEQSTLIGNRIRGPKLTLGNPVTNSRGIQIEFTSSATRADGFVCKSNVIGDVAYGFAASSGGTGNGPIVVGDNRFQDIFAQSIASSSDSHIYYGRWIDDTRVQIVEDDNTQPQSGVWIIGDRWQSVDSEYTCVVGGNGTDAVWQPLSLAQSAEAHSYGRLYTGYLETRPTAVCRSGTNPTDAITTAFTGEVDDGNSGLNINAIPGEDARIEVANLGQVALTFKLTSRCVFSTDSAVVATTSFSQSTGGEYAELGKIRAVSNIQNANEDVTLISGDEYATIPAGQTYSFKLNIGAHGFTSGYTASFAQLDFQVELV